MIVGKQILERELVLFGEEKQLKNSTYDLRIGRIFRIGNNAHKDDFLTEHYLKPREMVWVLSEEEFRMPETVTGLATLRTTYTRQGILAINVGIIDPLFEGPISTALINFSDRPRRVQVGEPFFRIAFFEHDDIREFHRKDERVDRDRYISDLELQCHSDFDESFLNIPNFDDQLYKKLLPTVWRGVREHRGVILSFIALLVVITAFLVSNDRIKISISYDPEPAKISGAQPVPSK